MSDLGQQCGYPLQRKDFVEIVANIDTDGIRAHDATVYQAQISQLTSQLQKIKLECEDLKVVRECNNQELIELESKRHTLTLQL